MVQSIKVCERAHADWTPGRSGGLRTDGDSVGARHTPPAGDPDLIFPGVTGASPNLRQAADKAARLAQSRIPVLLLGETGVGKEVFAQGIHACSQQRNGPFVALNCGGLNRDLLASELFGHVDGAFTGARRGGVAGKIEAANGGTLFLDELGEMPLELQPHFLRVLEDGQIYRIGENTPRQVRFRLVAATNRDLRQDVAEGRFRMDLFYRISVTSIAIPPLRERRADIPELARQFLRQFCLRHEVPKKVFDPRVLSRLEQHEWPGNVRELRNVVESLVVTSTGTVIGPDDLPPEIQSAPMQPVAACEDFSPGRLRGLQKSEFEQICRVLQQASGNATTAARELGIAKSTLYLKLKKYSLDKSLHQWRAH
jgi:transcriptional regulator with PAS, ATPase and Fis domain